MELRHSSTLAHFIVFHLWIPLEFKGSNRGRMHCLQSGIAAFPSIRQACKKSNPPWISAKTTGPQNPNEAFNPGHHGKKWLPNELCANQTYPLSTKLKVSTSFNIQRKHLPNGAHSRKTWSLQGANGRSKTWSSAGMIRQGRRRAAGSRQNHKPAITHQRYPTRLKRYCWDPWDTLRIL